MPFTQIAPADPNVSLFPGSPIVLGGAKLMMFGLKQETVWSAAAQLPGGAWSSLGSLGVRFLEKFAVVAIGGGFFVLGGQSAQAEATIYASPDVITWGLVTANAPFGPRYSMCALNYDGNMYVFAGRNATDACNDVWICTGGEMAWKQLTAHAPFPPTEQAGCASFAGGMFLLGGLSDHVATNQVWASYDGATWYNFGPAPWPGRYRPAVAVAGNALYVMGGSANDGNTLEDIWVTTTGKSWTQVDNFEPGVVNAIPPTATSDGVTIYVGSQGGIWAGQP